LWSTARWGIATLLLLLAAFALPPVASAQAVDYTVQLLGSPTKTSGCVVRAGNLPDPACTPGAVFPNVPLEVLCRVGYTDTIRSVPASVRHAVLAAYGVPDPPPAGTVEVDHLVPLGLSGSNDVENLFPQPKDPTPGYVQKDTIERNLRVRACSGDLPIRDAQVRIAWYWPGYIVPSPSLALGPDGEDELP
jgi:hypothetical protein